MVRVFQILAVILFGVAVFFLWKGEADAVFVSAVLSAVALLMSIRFQVKARIKQRASEEGEAESGEDILRK